MTVRFYNEKKDMVETLGGVKDINFYYGDNIACVHFADPGVPKLDIALENLYRIEA